MVEEATEGFKILCSTYHRKKKIQFGYAQSNATICSCL
jgi:hypothetical protein